MLETIPLYLDHSKSQDKQAVIYVNYILAVEKVGPTQRAQVWAEQLQLLLNMMSSKLRIFLQKLLYHDLGRRAKAEDCLKDPWLMNDWKLEDQQEEIQEQATFKHRKLCHT